MTSARRMLWLITLIFWQGGFMFYGAVVVPVGTDVLGSEKLQGFVTQSVTNYLNLAGVLALVVWGSDLYLGKSSNVGRFRLRSALLLMLMLLLGVLGWMHSRMDQLLDFGRKEVLDRLSFTRLHSWYLIISTLQWLLGLAFAGLTLITWQDEPLRKRGKFEAKILPKE